MFDPDGQRVCAARAKAAVPAPPLQDAPTLDRGWFEVGLPVKDIAVTQAWSRLGFVEVDRTSAGTSVTLSNGEAKIGLYQGHLDPDRLQLIFWQGDIDAMAALVLTAGLDFHSPPKSDENGGRAGTRSTSSICPVSPASRRTSPGTAAHSRLPSWMFVLKIDHAIKYSIQRSIRA